MTLPSTLDEIPTSYTCRCDECRDSYHPEELNRTILQYKKDVQEMVIRRIISLDIQIAELPDHMTDEQERRYILWMGKAIEYKSLFKITEEMIEAFKVSQKPLNRDPNLDASSSDNYKRRH